LSCAQKGEIKRAPKKCKLKSRHIILNKVLVKKKKAICEQKSVSNHNKNTKPCGKKPTIGWYFQTTKLKKRLVIEKGQETSVCTCAEEIFAYSHKHLVNDETPPS